jgi:hypothetical protein
MQALEFAGLEDIKQIDFDIREIFQRAEYGYCRLWLDINGCNSKGSPWTDVDDAGLNLGGGELELVARLDLSSKLPLRSYTLSVLSDEQQTVARRMSDCKPSGCVAVRNVPIHRKFDNVFQKYSRTDA